MSLVFGFGGVRDFDGKLAIHPHLPHRFARLGFGLRFRDRQLRITLTHDHETYELTEGQPVDVTIRGEPRRLQTGSPLVVPVAVG